MEGEDCMRATLFTAGILAGLTGAAVTAYAMKQTMPGTEMGYNVSRAAHRTAGTVSSMAHEAADAVDHLVR